MVNLQVLPPERLLIQRHIKALYVPLIHAINYSLGFEGVQGLFAEICCLHLQGTIACRFR